uniref:ARAD1D25850p n=1 Tax=Blastobotrys adeninivorans TaxID=409370 RepID=A0A060TAR4_BLAAD
MGENTKVQEHASVSNEPRVEQPLLESSGGPAPEGSVLAEEVELDPPQSRFVAHMATYPAVAALTGFAASFPVVKVFASNAVPLIMSYQNRDKGQDDGQDEGNQMSEPSSQRVPLQRRRRVRSQVGPIIDRADRFGDRMLTRLDKRYPQLQTAQPEEVYQMAREPLRRARTRAHTARNSARSSVHAARSRYARVYDTQGKPLVRSQLDPVLEPLNNRLEDTIIQRIPNSRIPDRKVTNEFSRTVHLGRSAARASRPIALNQTRSVYRFPSRARSHVGTVYTDKKIKHANGNDNDTSRRVIILASLGTGRQLARDGATRIRAARRRVARGAAPTEARVDQATSALADNAASSTNEPIVSDPVPLEGHIEPSPMVEEISN